MAKGIGLIGNFRGKVGNMVGYNLKDSNNKQTQGVRVYQPVVKNPKTAGQAEQRAKLAPINATYRALKSVIDRGQEGKAYGNKSRLAWLSDAMQAFNGAWFSKGAAIVQPALVPLTKGSLAGLPQPSPNDGVVMLQGVYPSDSAPTTMGALSTAILNKFPQVKEGDQITFICLGQGVDSIVPTVESIVIDTTLTSAIPAFLGLDDGNVALISNGDLDIAGAIVLSREGDNGSHLRSTTAIAALEDMGQSYINNEAKAAAIKSYMSQGANTDWAEESLQG